MWSSRGRWWSFLLFLVTSVLVGLGTIQLAQAAWLTEMGLSAPRLLLVLLPVGISLLPVFTAFLGQRGWTRFLGIMVTFPLVLAIPEELIGRQFAAVACAIAAQCSTGHEWTTGAYYLGAALMTAGLATVCAWSGGTGKDIDTILAERGLE
jgi:hypothetical protein